MTCHDTQNRTSPTLAELYPDLHRITLFIAFEEADSASEPSYQQIIFTPDTGAEFRLDCLRDACTCGGFDLAPVVADLVKGGESMVHGTLVCAGTLGAGGDPCRLTAEYRIIIE